MPTADPLPGSGWLPVDAIDEVAKQNDAASRDTAKRLVGLPPRARVLELMRLAATGAASGSRLRPDDLAGVLRSFDGADDITSEELCRILPDIVLDPDRGS